MPDDQLIHMTGFKLIKEMTRDELIEEIMLANRRNLESATDVELITYVANNRMAAYRKKILDEAGLTEGPFGTTSVAETDD